jgi:hypothetical protein
MSKVTVLNYIQYSICEQGNGTKLFKYNENFVIVGAITGCGFESKESDSGADYTEVVQYNQFNQWEPQESNKKFQKIYVIEQYVKLFCIQLFQYHNSLFQTCPDEMFKLICAEFDFHW